LFGGSDSLVGLLAGLLLHLLALLLGLLLCVLGDALGRLAALDARLGLLELVSELVGGLVERIGGRAQALLQDIDKVDDELAKLGARGDLLRGVDSSIERSVSSSLGLVLKGLSLACDLAAGSGSYGSGLASDLLAERLCLVCRGRE